jgi:hypothetical protein
MSGSGEIVNEGFKHLDFEFCIKAPVLNPISHIQSDR